MDYAEGDQGETVLLGGGRRRGGLHYQSLLAGPLFLTAAPAEGKGKEEGEAALLRRYFAMVHQSVPGGGGNSTTAESPPRPLRVGPPSELLSAPVAGTGVGAEGAPKAKGKEGGEREARNFKDCMLPALASFVHGRKDGVSKLVDGFLEQLQQEGAGGVMPSKQQVKRRILDIADRKRRRAGETSVSAEAGGEEGEQLDVQYVGTARWIVRQQTADELKMQVCMCVFVNAAPCGAGPAD